MKKRSGILTEKEGQVCILEEIVVGALFIYPGAIIEMLYRRYAKYGYKEESHAEPIKLAELFLNSVIVTILTVLFLRVFTNIKADTLSSLVFELNRFRWLMQYMILSAAVTCAVAWIRYKLTGMDPMDDRALDQTRVNGCRVAGSANAWRELIYGPDLKDILEHCILRITTSGGTSAGFASYLPDDFEKGIPLVQTAFVERMLSKEAEWEPDQRYIGEPYTVYIDPATGAKVEFFDGKELYDYLSA